MARRRRGRVRVAAIGALLLPFALLAASVPVLRERPLLAALEADTMDWRYRLRGPRVPEVPVTIIAIGDRDVRAHGGWPLPRAALAEAVDRLTDLGAAAVAVDLILAEPGRDPAGDRALATAFARSGRTLLGVALKFGGEFDDDVPASALGGAGIPLLRKPDAPALPSASGLLLPTGPLRAAAAGLGHLNVVLGRDGRLQQIYPVLLADGHALPALPVVAARVFRDLPGSALDVTLPGALRLDRDRVAIGPRGRWTLNFYGKAGSFATYPLRDLLAGAVRPSDVAGRIVWIGATATAVGDSFATPYDPQLPGVEAFATATANLLERRFLVRDGTALLAGMLGVFVVGALTVAAARARPALLGILLAPLPVLAWGGLAVLAFTAWQVWLNIAVPLMSGALAAIGVGIWRWLLSDRQRRRLAVYVPSRLAEALAAADRPGFAERRQPAAILFVDLAGFTAQSEAEGPDATAARLRRLHGLFEDAAAEHDGYVDSFSGDGAMLVFGVPEPGPRDGANALACAKALIARGRQAGLPLRAGTHIGTVQVARLGGRRHRQLTLAGDPVNLASRLIDVAKVHEAALAASDQLARAAARVDGNAVLDGLEFHADEAIRGRRQSLDVWTGSPPG